uniref:Uncharacterized protein n=1 Tax=Leersia perrieri TaxID=77586 RepID=A0A0D9XCM2_9ORYZ
MHCASRGLVWSSLAVRSPRNTPCSTFVLPFRCRLVAEKLRSNHPASVGHPVATAGEEIVGPDGSKRWWFEDPSSMLSFSYSST